MGEDDDELVHGLSYQNEYNERLFGVSCLKKGILEHWKANNRIDLIEPIIPLFHPSNIPIG